MEGKQRDRGSRNPDRKRKYQGDRGLERQEDRGTMDTWAQTEEQGD